MTNKLINIEDWVKDFCDRVGLLCSVREKPPLPGRNWNFEKALRLNERVFDDFRLQISSRNILFIDPHFVPTREIVGSFPFAISWLRPAEIRNSPETPVLLTRAQHEPYRMARSQFGNKNLAAAIYAISFNDALLCQVMPDGQSFFKDYAGIFMFRFWHFGDWLPVVIDDRLPVRSNSQEFVFNYFCNMPDIWVCLVEKAYAKFLGGYGEIKKMNLLDILRHFTGGIGEFYNVKSMNKIDMTAIKMCLDRGSLVMGLMSQGSDRCYRVSGIYKKKHGDSVKIYVRLWNPFDVVDDDNATDGLPRSASISKDVQMMDFAERNCLDLAPNYKNTRWMSLEDFIATFDYLLICNPRYADVSHITDGHWCSLRKWNFFTVRSSWVSKKTYASPCQDINRICCNSQIRFKVTVPDYKGQWKTSRCTVVVSLLQMTEPVNFDRTRLHSVSLLVYDLQEPEKEPLKLSQKYFDLNEPLYESDHYPEVEISIRLSLSRGTYVIIPINDHNDLEEEYLLTLVSVNPVEYLLPLSRVCLADSKLEASIESPESITMGDSVEAIVYVTNNHCQVKRVFYYVISERDNDILQPITAKTGFVKLGPMLSLVIPIKITFFEYADLVQLKLKGSTLRLRCFCYIFEDRSFAMDEKFVRITLPLVQIIPIGPVFTGEQCQIEAVWTNTLPVTVYLCSFCLDNSIRNKRSVAKVKPYKTVRYLFLTRYFRSGWNEITVDFESHIIDLRGSLRLMVEDSYNLV